MDMAGKIDVESRSRTLRRGIAVGALSTVALIGWLHLCHAWFGTPFVPLDVTDVIIRITPGPLATAGIEALGKWAQRLLIVAGFVGVLVVGTIWGAWASLSRRLTANRWARLGVLALVPLLVTIAMELVLDWNGASAITGFIVLSVSYACWAWIITWLLEPREAPTISIPATNPVWNRRTLLRRLGLATLGVIAGAWLVKRMGAPRSAQPPKPLPGSSAGELPTATPFAGFTPAPGTRHNTTPLQDFYVVDISTRSPNLDLTRWRLLVKGLVDAPLELTSEDLLAYQRVDTYGTLQCISNEVGGDLIGTAQFNGLRLRDVLLAAQPRQGVLEVVTRSLDAYTESLPFSEAMHPDTLLVYGMNGQTLSAEHGYPLRIYNPNHYGMKNPKWLAELELVDKPFDGYWEQRGWDKAALIKTTSVIDTRGQLVIDGDSSALGGVALAGWRGIQRVEVRLNDGEWRPAQLDQPLSRFTWVRWRYDWPLPPRGTHRVTVRAVDGDGAVQTEVEAAPHPDGASGWHTIRLSV